MASPSCCVRITEAAQRVARRLERTIGANAPGADSQVQANQEAAPERDRLPVEAIGKVRALLATEPISHVPASFAVGCAPGGAAPSGESRSRRERYKNLFDRAPPRRPAGAPSARARAATGWPSPPPTAARAPPPRAPRPRSTAWPPARRRRGLRAAA